MQATDRDLGMMRAISRRDFLNGVGVALTGAALARDLAELHHEGHRGKQAK
jgi:hypothetical protein